jgi:hypothetical protein
VRNITAAVGRLPFARKAKVRILDAKKGLVVFTPDPGRKFEYEGLAKAYKRASYGIKQVELTAVGTVEEHPDPQDPARKVLVLNVQDTGNLFLLRAAEGPTGVFPVAGSEVTVRGTLEPGKGSPDTLLVTSSQPSNSQ